MATNDPLRKVKQKLFPRKGVQFPSEDPKLFAEIMSLLLQHEVSYLVVVHTRAWKEF